MDSRNLISKQKINQIEPIDTFGKFKGDYFLRFLFDHLEKKKLLEILKCNKNIKKRINININDYKEYSEKFSSIEIELIPEYIKYGKFINIKDELYYDIYFNNNKEEIKKSNKIGW